jgi:ankyrin repeat protein
MEVLIAAGADADGPDQDGVPPLVRAAYSGASEAVQYLLENWSPGAASRATALDIATEQRQLYGSDIGGTAAVLEASQWSG